MIDPIEIVRKRDESEAMYQSAQPGTQARLEALEKADAWQKCVDLVIPLMAAVADAERLEKESGLPDVESGNPDALPSEDP